MLIFGSWTIAISEIKVISAYASNDINYPYGLRVTLKDNSEYSINYSSEKTRNQTQERLIVDLNRRNENYLQYINNNLISLSRTLERLEKRQLRIQKLLKMEDVII